MTDDFQACDVVLTHRRHLIARLISLGQKWRFRGPDAVYAHWSHCALIVDRAGTLVEAEALGVERSPLSKYDHADLEVVRVGQLLSADEKRRVIDYAEDQVGQAFDYLALLGAAIYLVTGIPLRLMRPRHQTCSGLVVRALQRGGLLRTADPHLTLPADLAETFTAAGLVDATR